MTHTPVQLARRLDFHRETVHLECALRMIEGTARHNGRLDAVRKLVDGVVGD
ncbi:hypothetical protein AB0M46_21230 [Dactylosporangium sp. NPDC051485]|uniref:hypothetical protein n=1 Tax=Dactylosporangium sp. NPDC051485 TaxID=3154846 RepID=UPI00342DDFAA